MLFWLVDGVVLSTAEIWVLGQWTKNNEEIIFSTSSLMDAMTQNIHRMILKGNSNLYNALPASKRCKNGYFQLILDIQNEPIRPIYWSSMIKGYGSYIYTK